jgi:hypothetical protein
MIKRVRWWSDVDGEGNGNSVPLCAGAYKRSVNDNLD